MTDPAVVLDGIRIWHGTATAALREIPDGTAQTCITSPPFWGLRDYGTGTWTGGRDDCDHAPTGSPDRDHSDAVYHDTRGEQGARGSRAKPQLATCSRCGAQRVDQQIGLEHTPDAWVARLVDVFREVRRVLRDDVPDAKAGNVGNDMPMRVPDGLKPKDLVGAPWMLAFALRADGWYLRSDCIWARPNPMPESVTDRPTKAHSYVFLLTKQPRYYFDADAIREPHTPDGRKVTTRTVGNGSHDNYQEFGHDEGRERWPNGGRNARTVWSIATEPTPFAHFATFPQVLVERCIVAGTSERGQCPACGAPWARQVERTTMVKGQSARRETLGEYGRTAASGTMLAPPTSTTTGWAPTCTCAAGDPVPQTVLDPFMGSGTTALVARRLGRHAVGTELSAEYLEIAAKRLHLPAYTDPARAPKNIKPATQPTLFDT